MTLIIPCILHFRSYCGSKIILACAIALPVTSVILVINMEKYNGETIQSQEFLSKNTTDFGPQKTATDHSSLALGSVHPSTDGRYMRHPHVWPHLRNAAHQMASVCVTTQASVSRISTLPRLLTTWTGPISVAVYTPGSDYTAFSVMLQYLERCFPNLKHRLSFHVLYPRDNVPVLRDHNITVDNLDCQNPVDHLKMIFAEFKNYNDGREVEYPQNHLRNLARQSCSASYSLTIDVDLVPSLNMFERMSLMLEGNKCVKCALVIPVYEIEISQRLVPANKNALLSLIWIENKAQPFYKMTSPEAHHSTDNERWELIGSKSADQEPLFWPSDQASPDAWNLTLSSIQATEDKKVPFRIGYQVPRSKYLYWWEPFVVLPSSAPAWDERFVGYGIDRKTQAREGVCLWSKFGEQ